MATGGGGAYRTGVFASLPLALLSSLVLASPRRVFATQPIVPEAAAALVCRVTNEARDGRRLRVEALDAAGRTTSDTGPFVLEPGATYLSSGGLAARRCRFTVEGDPRGVRAHGLVLSPHGGVLSLPPERAP